MRCLMMAISVERSGRARVMEDLLSGVELRLIIAALKNAGYVSVMDPNGFEVALHRDVKAEIIRKLEARV